MDVGKVDNVVCHENWMEAELGAVDTASRNVAADKKASAGDAGDETRSTCFVSYLLLTTLGIVST